MPSRRNTLLGLGLLAAGGTGAVATGAFSAATADRDVTVEFADDIDGVLGFESTSAYTEIEDGMLGLSFTDLNRNTDFTFQDVFVIRNNGTQPVRFDRVQTPSDSNAEWNYDDEESPAHVLVANEKNAWQGNIPDPSAIDEEQWNFQDDPDEEYISANVGRTIARDALDGSSDFALEPGDFVSLGFGFWGTNGVGSWDESDIPETLQLNFGADDLNE